MSEQPYEKLKFYQDICEIRKMVYSVSERFCKSHLRLVSQMRDAARSSKQNIREGYRRGSLGIFINSIRISQGSLEELSGDIVLEEEGEELQDLIKKIRGKLKESDSLKQEYLEGWQRAKADLINLNRKIEEEKINLAKFATQNIIAELIPVLDSFEMAFKGNLWEDADKIWKTGIENIYEKLKSIMIQNGMSEIKPAIGEIFDPKEHEAVYSERVDSPEKDNAVTSVVQSGFKLNDRVIRAAKVKVGEYKEN